MEKNILRIISIALFVAYALLFKGCCDYKNDKKVECIVLDKVPSEGKYSSNFYLILQETTGEKRSFDLYVSPLTYSQSKKNKVYYMKLSEFEIKQTPTKNLLYVFLMPMLILIAPILLILSFFTNKL